MTAFPIRIRPGDGVAAAVFDFEPDKPLPFGIQYSPNDLASLQGRYSEAVFFDIALKGRRYRTGLSPGFYIIINADGDPVDVEGPNTFHQKYEAS
ncbi:MAG: hypothetical protein ACR2P5_05990 [Gammaproteobacteria bacterium]